MRPHEALEFEGCRLAYRMEGAGPPLVMIQGVGAHGLAWNPQVEILREHFKCLTFDNRGIGLSQPAAKRLSVEQMAADTLALMDHAGWASAHIVGHSLGGLAALQFALIARARVRSLSILCAFAHGARAARMTPALLWIVLRIKFGPRSVRRRAFMELVLASGQRGYSKDALERITAVFGHDLADMPKITSQQVEAMRMRDVSGRLHEFSGIPTFVINGEKDMIAPPALGREIATGIPGARFFVFPGGGHAFPVMDAERCAALIVEHLTAAERTLQAEDA